MSVGPARLVLVPKTLGVSMSDVPARVAKRSSQPTRSTLSQRTKSKRLGVCSADCCFAMAKQASQNRWPVLSRFVLNDSLDLGDPRACSRGKR